MSAKKINTAILTGLATVLILTAAWLSFVHEAGAAVKTAVVTGSTVNVRTGPGTDYNKIGTIVKGEKFEVLEQQNDWYRLKLDNQGRSGWVLGTYLNVLTDGGSGSSQPEVSQSPRTAEVKGRYINARSGPGTIYNTVARLNKGEKYPVVKQSGGWISIDLGNGKSGWLAGWLVKVNSGITPGEDNSKPDNPRMYLIVKESIVNVRSGPGTTFSIVTKVRSGEKFTVLNKSGDWYMVSLPDNRQGWIAGWLAEVYVINTPSRGDPDLSPTPPLEPAEPDPVVPDPGNGGGNSQPAPKISGFDFKMGDNGEELLIIRSESSISYKAFFLTNPLRLVIDIDNSDVNGMKDFTPDGAFIKTVRVAQFSLSPMVVRVVLDLDKPANRTIIPGDDGRILTVTLSEPSIKGKVIVIDAGHGGYDPGAIGVTGLEEKAFNLDTALRLKNKLSEQGATVIMTREDDSFVGLTTRATVANNAYADVFISIHANSSENSSKRGTSVHYYAPYSDPKLYAQFEERNRLAKTVQDYLVTLAGTIDLGIKQDNFSVLRNTEMPSILVETAFLSNREDEALLKNSQFRENVAQGIADGLTAYFAGTN